jgi:hypothetical protein
VSTLARILEERGLATVTLSLVRAQAEAVRPPRCLHVDFPLGRPFGNPRDPEFQLRVLRAAFALLERPEGPVLEDFPETIETAVDDEMASCVLPPRSDPSLPVEVDEVLALRPAYERQRASTGLTLVGRMIRTDQIADAVGAFIAIADGTPWEQAPFPVPATREQHPSAIAFDIRAYYEEAALAMADHVPAARGPEDWFFRHTATGALLRRAQEKLRAADVPQGVWNALVPTRQREVRVP